MGKQDETKGASPSPPQPQTPPAPVKKTVVEVRCEGALGTQLLRKGDRTSHPEYVALLEDERDLVRPVE